MVHMQHRLAIFLSGSGSNARNICKYFEKHAKISICLLLSNKEDSAAKAISEQFNIPYFIFNKEEFYHTDVIVSKLDEFQIDTIILAGFLWLIPVDLLKKFHNRIINIHPALLPKYGGKGMHGMYVHQAVFENKEKESGITIHLCNEKYDDGKTLYQKKVAIDENDSAENIQKKVLQLEHDYFPVVIENFLTNNHD